MNFTIKFIEKNKTKIFSFFCGILIWFLVVTENQYESIVAIPIKTINLKTGYVIANEIPDQVKIRFQGKGRDLMAMHLTKGAEVIIDLARQEGRFFHEIETNDIKITKNYKGMEAVNIFFPDTFTIFIDELTRKPIPIVSNIKVNPAPGYAIVGDVQFSPDTVYVNGPFSELTSISCARTDSLVFNNRIRDIKEQVALVPPLSARARFDFLKTLATVDIQKLLERAFTGVPVKIKNLPPKTRAIIIPSTLDITIDGGEDLMVSIQKEDLVAYIDYSKKPGPNEHDYPAFIETPPGVNYRKVQPKRFKVILEKD